MTSDHELISRLVWGSFGRAVEILFIVSGFVVFLPTVARGGNFGSIGSFAVRRGARLLPAYWLILLISIVLIAAINPVSPVIEGSQIGFPPFRDIAVNFFGAAVPLGMFIPGIATGFGIDPPVWTLSVELGFYIVLPLVAVAFFPVMLAFAIARPTLHNVTWAMAVTVFGVVWIGVPLAHAVLLRDIPEHGGALLVDVLVCTFFTDTFAYVGGRMFGQHPLAPTVSPNKTIEGLVIGIAGGVFGFWLAGLYQDWLSGADALLMGLCIAILAPMGDLFESAIKRDLDVKDTGRMLGPHGGLLDRLDAVLFTVVAGYYLALAIVV